MIFYITFAFLIIHIIDCGLFYCSLHISPCFGCGNAVTSRRAVQLLQRPIVIFSSYVVLTVSALRLACLR